MNNGELGTPCSVILHSAAGPNKTKVHFNIELDLDKVSYSTFVQLGCGTGGRAGRPLICKVGGSSPSYGYSPDEWGGFHQEGHLV